MAPAAATSEAARFAGREFVAELERELGQPLPMVAQQQIAFAHEMGYMRGYRARCEQELTK